MSSETLEALAERVSAGDDRARSHLCASLEPHLERIVRRALERGDPSSSIVRKIAAAARRLGGERQGSGELAGLVAENLKRTIVNRLWGRTEQLGFPSTVL